MLGNESEREDSIQIVEGYNNKPMKSQNWEREIIGSEIRFVLFLRKMILLAASRSVRRLL